MKCSKQQTKTYIMLKKTGKDKIVVEIKPTNLKKFYTVDF